ncbi:hypothetical protein HH310_30935 [Actinoplanes sp. TBRC 11911]|uniref:hypothetical protein n=1 Tax=Actinoplanes sp. TBRC 11911 TaxID=2729386 RepID=UPI00145CCCBD|nr:hypothetical protein [Actinoplanes sp. TBRC 11911]NMO55588.1 hypothetical protein [Actinoplanes sp. TBRC 11911]
MRSVNPYVVVEEPTFVVRFLLDARVDTADSVANVDAFVDLPDGSSWALTIFTADEVRRRLAVWKATGEVANGSYFWAVDQVIVPKPGLPAMTAAIRELVRSGELASVGVRCESP